MITLDMASKEFAVKLNNIKKNNLEHYRKIGESLLVERGFPDNFKSLINESLDDFSEIVIDPIIDCYLSNERTTAAN